MKIKRSPGLPRGFPVDPEDPTALILRPIGLLAGMTAHEAIVTGQARHLAGGPLAFTAAEIFLRQTGGVEIVGTAIWAIEEWATAEGGATAAAVAQQMYALSLPRAAVAGLSMDRPRLMGVVNVTPDSFYDGGRLPTSDAAVAHGRALRDAGADILDIGGESTRPGSDPVSEQQEMDRILPVIERLTADGALVSADTRRAPVMRAACAAGARIINDVSALTDPGALEAVAETGAAVVLMHMQGSPQTMQNNPAYDHAPYEVARFLTDRIASCEAAGIERDAIVVDPGIGFGKTVVHNLRIFDQLALFHATGCAVMVGASRKSFIGAIDDWADRDNPNDRLPGSLAAATIAASQGVQLHRVHDVAATRQALSIIRAVGSGGE
jgi:dihydropteroate synthase